MRDQSSTENRVKNICFVANFEKTFVFDKVADQLILLDPNVEIFWIVVNNKLFNFLKTKYKSSNILYIPKDIPISDDDINIHDLKINEIVYYDRFLSLDIEKGINYLNKSKTHIYNFIKKNNLDYIFGESTWAHELLISRICNYHLELSCSFLSPQMIRLPQDRFAFFKNECEDIDVNPNIDYQQLEYPNIILERQDYIDIIAKEVKRSIFLGQRLNRIKRFISKENVSHNDPSVLYDFFQRLKRGIQEEWNKTTYRFVKKNRFIDLPEGNKYLYTLHVQPEASIDVLGRYYNNQYQNILNIWKNMPDGHMLMVKEHRTGIGNRKFHFYNKISKLKNVYLISENEDPHYLIKKCKAVFTVSGTIAYEAALLEKPSFTFAPVFFNKLVNCHKLVFDDLVSCVNLQELIDKKSIENNKKMNLEKFSKYVYLNSYQGSWAPEFTNTFSDKNINSLAISVMSLYKNSK